MNGKNGSDEDTEMNDESIESNKNIKSNKNIESDKNSKSAFERIYDVVRQIPRGKVATYGQVAALAGNKHWARVVGYALHENPDPDHIPCYRVVNREGHVSKAFAFGGSNRQIALLEADGIPCPDGVVDLDMYQWKHLSLSMAQEMFESE